MRTKPVMAIAAMALTTALAVSCNKKSEGDSGNQGSDTSSAPPETGEASTVAMSGSLALTVDDGAALSLQAATYNLYCVTFEETPKACKGDIASDGNFGFSCEGFVGRAFGCFLRDGVKTLGTVEFGEDSQLLAGAGDLVFNMVFNPETGSIKATIDMEKSSSLSEAALAAFKGFIDNNKTSMADLTGNWEIKPDCTKNPEMCPPDMGEKGDTAFPVYMEQYVNADGKTFLAMWDSEERKNQCGGSTGLTFKIAGASVDFTSKEKLMDSLRNAMGSLDATLAAKIKELAVARGNKQYSWCETQQDNPFTTDNCRLVKPTIETYTYKDENGVEKTESYPKYYSSEEFASLQSVTGDGITDVTCSFEWKEGVPGCPRQATKNADGTGTFKQATLGGVGLMLICKDPYNEQNLMHDPAPALTLGDSIKSFENQKPKECEKITDGAFANEYRASAQEAARAILDMARISPDDHWAQEMCDRYNIPADWSWAKCAGTDMHNMPSTCWESQWQRDNLGIVIENGVLKAATTNKPADWFNADEYLNICPTAAKAAKTAQSTMTDQMEMQQMAATYISQCRSELLKLSAVQQAQAFAKTSQQWQPLGEILYCAADTKAAASALASSSCTADARLDYQCGPNGCEEILMCSGSSAGGRCYDDAGNFAGRVSGRDDNMLMKMGIGGAFSMSQSEQDFWRSWDPDTNQQQKCIYSRISSMNNLKIDDNSFSGIYSSNSTEKCEADEEQKMALQDGPSAGPDGGPDGGGGEGGDGGGKEGGGTETIPFVATRK